MQKIKILTHKNYFYLGLISFYLLITIIFSYPVVTNISKNVWGYSGDNFGGIWTDWWINYAEGHRIPKNFSPLVNYPFGMNIDVNSQLEPVWTLPTQFLSKFIGEVASFNLIILLSFPLAGLTMFLLLDYLTKSRAAALIGGMVYMLLPYHFWQSYQHIALAQTQWIPLYLFALFKLEEKLSLKFSIFTGIAFSLVALSSVYHGYFIVLFTVVYVLLKFLYQAIFIHINYFNLKRVGMFAVTGIVALVFVFPVYFSALQSAKSNQQFSNFLATGRPINDLLSFSTRPWDFIIPPEDQPFLGRFEEPLYSAIRKISNDYKTISAYLPERIVYVGIPSLLLALLGTIFLIKRKEKRENIVILNLAALLLYIIASPPFIIIHGITFYFPSAFLYKFIPIVRVYSRMGIVIDLLVIAIAAFGILFVINQVKSILLKRIVIVGLALFFILEFLNFPPYHYTSIAKIPATYQWLSDHQDGGAIVEYPQGYSLVDSLFFQRIYQHPLLNITGLTQSSSFANIAPLINNPVSANTAGVLAALGIKYAVVHSQGPYNRSNFFDETGSNQVLAPALVATLQGNGVPGFSLESKVNDGAILKITSQPAKVFINDSSKINVYPPGNWVWKGEYNRVYLVNTKTTPVSYFVSFPKNSLVKIIDPTGKEIIGQDVVKLGVNSGEQIKIFEIKNLSGKSVDLSGIIISEVK